MYKILIVEDDETIAGGLKNHLEKWNYQAECMTDFKDVMGKFVEFEPQLVLLDIVLPFFNGDRKSTRLNSSHYQQSRMPSSA